MALKSNRYQLIRNCHRQNKRHVWLDVNSHWMKPSSEKLLFATCLWWKYCHYNIVDILLRCFFVQTSRPVYIRVFKIISSVTHKLAAYTSLLHTQACCTHKPDESLFSVLWKMSLLQGSAGPQPLKVIPGLSHGRVLCERLRSVYVVKCLKVAVI